MRGMADQAAAKKATPKSRRWPRGKICIAASAAVHVERAGHRNRPLMRLPPRLAASSFSPRPQASGPQVPASGSLPPSLTSADVLLPFLLLSSLTSIDAFGLSLTW